MAKKMECELLICSQWKPAKLTLAEYKNILKELKGSGINKEYPIRLLDGDIIDLGIIDGVRG